MFDCLHNFLHFLRGFLSCMFDCLHNFLHWFRDFVDNRVCLVCSLVRHVVYHWCFDGLRDNNCFLHHFRGCWFDMNVVGFVRHFFRRGGGCFLHALGGVFDHFDHLSHESWFPDSQFLSDHLGVGFLQDDFFVDNNFGCGDFFVHDHFGCGNFFVHDHFWGRYFFLCTTTFGATALTFVTTLTCFFAILAGSSTSSSFIISASSAMICSSPKTSDSSPTVVVSSSANARDATASVTNIK